MTGRGSRATRGFAAVVVVTTALPGGTTASADVTNPVGLPFTATAGVPFDRTIAEFGSRYTEVSNFSATIDWGDATAPQPGQITSSCAACPTPTYAVAGAHSYAAAGQHIVSVVIHSAPDAATAGVTLGVDVAGPPPIEPPPPKDLGGPAKACVAYSMPGPHPVYAGVTYKRVVGTNGADVIPGSGGPDMIIARGGADRISGGQGRDILSAPGRATTRSTPEGAGTSSTATPPRAGRSSRSDIA